MCGCGCCRVGVVMWVLSCGCFHVGVFMCVYICICTHTTYMHVYRTQYILLPTHSFTHTHTLTHRRVVPVRRHGVLTKTHDYSGLCRATELHLLLSEVGVFTRCIQVLVFVVQAGLCEGVGIHVLSCVCEYM